MSSVNYKLCKLSNRSLVNLAGKDAFSYVQSFLTNDIRKANPASYGVMLSATAKILADLMVYVMNGNPSERQLALTATAYKRFGIDGKSSDNLLVECDSSLAEPIRKTFFCYKIRRNVTISHAPEYSIFTLFPDLETSTTRSLLESPSLVSVKSDDFLITKDPRIGPLGYRILTRLGTDTVESMQKFLSHLVPNKITEAKLPEYRLFRHKIGLAEGANEYWPHHLHPLELNIDYMNGLSVLKGQFTGKEPPVRQKLKNQNTLRLMPIELLPPPGLKSIFGLNLARFTSIVDRNGAFSGKLLAKTGKHGLALINLPKARKNNFKLIHQCSECEIIAKFPIWWPDDVKIRYLTTEKFLPLPHLPPRSYLAKN